MYGLNILITCLFMYNATGSEMYFNELAKSLSKLGHNVTVLTDYCSEYFKNQSIQHNYKIVKPSFADSETKSKQYNLIIISHANKMFRYLSEFNLSRQVKFINIVHSEIYPDEHPLISPIVNKYVAIRKPIQDMLINKFNISENKIKIIYNPIDIERFNTNEIQDDNLGLFIGSLNYLRIPSCLDFNEYCKSNNLKTMYIGTGNHEALGYDYKLEPVWNIEEYIKKSTVCGGIIHGRTYWEAKLCGKQTIEYIIDDSGKIINKIIEDKPDEIEMQKVLEKVSSQNVAESMIDCVFSRI